MHVMKHRVQVLRPALVARVEPCHLSEGRHNNVGLSLRESRATMQVMLGLSLRARWDSTLVSIMLMTDCDMILERQSTDSH